MGPDWTHFITVTVALAGSVVGGFAFILLRVAAVSEKAHARMSVIEAEDRRGFDANAREIAELKTYVARNHPTNEQLAQAEARIRADIGEVKDLLRAGVAGQR